jgi:hypothetical protein
MKLADEAPPDQSTQRLHAALEANIPIIYANAFVCGLGTSDVIVGLERNGKPVAVLNLSYTSTKSFVVALSGIISQLEEISKQPVMTSKDVETYLAKTPPTSQSTPTPQSAASPAE